MWHRVLGNRCSGSGIWREVVEPLIGYGVDPVELIAWLDYYKIDDVTTHASSALEAAREGWMSAAVRDIPWTLRHEYRTTYRQVGVDRLDGGMTPLEAARYWFPIYQQNPARHDQLLEALVCRIEYRGEEAAALPLPTDGAAVTGPQPERPNLDATAVG
ncbi:hypothetical protein AB0J83_03380 [Actinoplanes sp. NPDC049596]|uniref:hypothetical protein n=1 Tax=unclassified Actinoplanes TaxID=2626549 RepID=UPI003418C588